MSMEMGQPSPSQGKGSKKIKRIKKNIRFPGGAEGSKNKSFCLTVCTFWGESAVGGLGKASQQLPYTKKIKQNNEKNQKKRKRIRKKTEKT